MRFGITSDLVRLRTLEPGEAATVARTVVMRVRGLEERSLLAHLEQFPEGQILAFDTSNRLIGWSLHLRVPHAAHGSLRRVGTPSLHVHDAEGALLMPFETEIPLGKAGTGLREAFDVARQALLAGLGLDQVVKGVSARVTQVA